MNPWQKVPLTVYEGHMSGTDVQQLQALNRVMKAQWQAYPAAETAAVLGVAGGNGLEHCGSMIKMIYGIDINKLYLEVCSQRHGEALKGRLELLQLDLIAEHTQLPKVDLLIADLVIEYIGIEKFCKKAAESLAKMVSCVIQLPISSGFVSDSPYQAQLQEIGELHCDIPVEALEKAFALYGYREAYNEVVQLPNGKCLQRLDYQRQA